MSRKRSQTSLPDEDVDPGVRPWGGPLTRRGFLHVGAAGVGALALAAAPEGWGVGKPYGPFPMGIQSYSLRHYGVPEMLKKVRDLGLSTIEGWNGHFPYPDSTADVPAKAAEYKAALKKAGVKMRAYGAVGFGGDAEENRRIFAFAKALGVETITADPDPASFPQLDALVKEFDVRVAIHNHGPGARYDTAESVYQALEGRDRRIGACVDTGHFLRSNVNPVEVVDHLRTRVFDIHLKDVKKENGRKVFTELGRGDLNLDRLYELLDRFHYRGLVALEYEEHEEDPVPYISESLKAWRFTARHAQMGND